MRQEVPDVYAFAQQPDAHADSELGDERFQLRPLRPFPHNPKFLVGYPSADQRESVRRVDMIDCTPVVETFSRAGRDSLVVLATCESVQTRREPAKHGDSASLVELRRSLQPGGFLGAGIL